MKRKRVATATAEFRLKSRANHWAERLRVRPTQIRIQQMSRKWASCSSRGRITLARDLGTRLRTMQDYVIVHELLHLRYPNHGKLFKAVMSVHLPGWKFMEEKYLRRKSRHSDILPAQ